MTDQDRRPRQRVGREHDVLDIVFETERVQPLSTATLAVAA
jgi:hypothetical protein